MKFEKAPAVPDVFKNDLEVYWARLYANMEFDILTMENQNEIDLKKTNHLNKLIRLQPCLDEYLKLIGKK